MSAQRATAWPFIRLYGLAFLFFSANSVLNVIVPLRSESMGASNATIGFIMGTYMLTCMFFRPWAGHLVGKYGPIRVLRVLLIVNGTALLLYTVTGLEGFVAARLLQGICTAFFSMALQMGIIDSLPDEERSQGVSLYSLSTYMPTIVGPIIAFGIWEWGRMNAFTATMIAIAVTTGLFGYSASIQADSVRKEQHSDVGMLNALRRIAEHPYLLVCSLIMLAVSVVFGAVSVFIPLYVQQVAYGNAGIYLMLQAGVIVYSRFVLRKRIPSDGKWHQRFIIGILLLAAVAAVLLSLSESAGFVLLYAAAILMGIAQALLYPTLTTYLTFVLPSASRNIGIGLFIASADFGISLGGIALGPVADHSSYSAMYAVCSGLVLAAVCVAMFYKRQMNPIAEKRI
ncbi:MFS transporter [Paenibacillus mesophilus]|uniref:staphylopine family metallophore export MFS transporter CntE n=1 Tax=Paenibacillus mesophilus TaxID=2582849 RepID=UPI00110D4F70|nr:MFS transporter [Paenibacillus mesophilus]TMV47827.1 MFS transporter [Paenibacillus mesophilus]